jgi:hypothetical protein
VAHVFYPRLVQDSLDHELTSLVWSFSVKGVAVIAVRQAFFDPRLEATCLALLLDNVLVCRSLTLITTERVVVVLIGPTWFCSATASALGMVVAIHGLSAVLGAVSFTAVDAAEICTCIASGIYTDFVCVVDIIWLFVLHTPHTTTTYWSVSWMLTTPRVLAELTYDIGLVLELILRSVSCSRLGSAV